MLDYEELQRMRNEIEQGFHPGWVTSRRHLLNELSKKYEAELAALREQSAREREAWEEVPRLLEAAEDMRSYTHEWDWKYGDHWDNELRMARKAVDAVLAVVTAAKQEAGKGVNDEAWRVATTSLGSGSGRGDSDTEGCEIGRSQ